ncbi:MAG: phosphatidylserine decarboxylase [Thermoanaerobaculia bacterium]|nr:phosphatidylserine decarboxylase [Thermoanaerobaculia bacterium]
MKFARESLPFVLPFVLAAVVALVLRHPVVAAILAVLGFGVLLFFRDPKRHPPADPRAILAPADGLVTRIDRISDPKVGPGEFERIVTFLSVFDVHVQKVPTDGRVIYAGLTPGKKEAAFKPDVDHVNEYFLSVVERANGDRVGIRQIAGLLARRVVCYLNAGDSVARSQALGVIKFGSRVDLLVPAGYAVQVKKGDRVKNGETILALPPAGLP